MRLRVIAVMLSRILGPFVHAISVRNSLERSHMRIRYRTVLPLFAAMMFCQAQSSTHLGAMVENIRYENNMSVALATIVNTSQKDITAFTVSVDINYQNGRQSHFEQTRDLLPTIISRQGATGASTLGDGAFSAGRSTELRIDIGQITAVSVKATVIAVIYIDRTGEGDAAALSRITSDRQQWAGALEEGTTIISEAIANSLSDPAGAAIRRIKSLLNNIPHDKDGMRRLTLQTMIDDIQAKSRKGDLSSYAIRKNQDAQYGFDHAKIRRFN
jgi:hypothetical protein